MELLTIRDHWIKKLKIPSYTGEWMFWFSLSLLLITQFSQGTMYILYYPSGTFPYHIFMVAGVIAILKILLFNNFRDLKDFFLFITIGLLILVGCQQANDWNFIYYYLIIFAGQDIEFEKIIRLFLIIIISGLVITFISSKLGIIVNLTNSRANDPGVRFALGMVYPTDLAARAFYIQLFYIVYRKFRLTLPEIISSLAFTLMIYFFTDTRLDLILMLLTLIAVIFYKQIVNFIKIIGNKLLLFFGILSVGLVILFTYLYQPSSFVFKVANKVLSGRLEYGHEAFVRYNVTMFGQFVQQNGNGGIHHGWFDYFFIDCSFIRILIMNGLVCFTIILIALCYLSNKFIKEDCYALEIALILTFISSLIDQHLIEISFNILFLTMYSNLNFFKEFFGIKFRY